LNATLNKKLKKYIHAHYESANPGRVLCNFVIRKGQSGYIRK
jgi:hypothetical protein